MTNGDCAVCVLGILHQDRGHRLTDDVASPDDDAIFSRRLDPTHPEHLTYPSRSARKKSVALSDQHLADVHWMKSIDVLGRMDASHHSFGIDLLRQRSLDENAVNLRVGIELIDLPQ